MIRLRAYAVFTEIPGQGVGALSAGAVNDAAIVRPAANERQQLFVRRSFWNDTVSETLSVKTGDITTRVAQLQFLHDVYSDPLCGRRGERHHWHIRKMRP